MLFRPTPDQDLFAIHAILDSWNDEADHFRRAAHAARRGETPTSLTVSAADETHEALLTLVSEIDEALGAVTPGSAVFVDLLHAQKTASALAESVSKSCDILAGVITIQIASPTHLKYQRIAAE